MVAGLLMLEGQAATGVHPFPLPPQSRPGAFEPRLRASGVLTPTRRACRSGGESEAEAAPPLKDRRAGECRCHPREAGPGDRAAQVKAITQEALKLRAAWTRAPRMWPLVSIERVYWRWRRRRAVIDATGSVRLKVDGVEMEGARLITNPRLDEGRLLSE